MEILVEGGGKSQRRQPSDHNGNLTLVKARGRKVVGVGRVSDCCTAPGMFLPS